MESAALLLKALCVAGPTLALASKQTNSQVTKEFNFKEDFYLKLCPLANAIGPTNVGLLASALEDFGAHFKEAWESQLKADLHNGTCTITGMQSPKFSICDWRYPDKYDVNDLPTPGQSYVFENCFVQRIYYQFSRMTISCQDDFFYDDLNKDAYTTAAFSGDAFVSILREKCSDSDVDCIFSSSQSADVDESDSESAKLFISRYLDLPVYLKCLDLDGYGTSIADMLIKALDKYFEIYIAEAITEKILAEVPEAHVYGYASPYKSQRKFCAHGPYFAGGNLVDQVRDSDGILITKLTYGFDVIWFKPKEFDQELLPDIESTINEIFVYEDFLLFIQEKFPQFDFIQDTRMCNVVHLDSIQVTFAPTESPTQFSASLLDNGAGCTSSFQCASGYCHEKNGVCACDIASNYGCKGSGQVCRFSCAFFAEEPRCFYDEYKRDCEAHWGNGYSCADGNGDGLINALDKNSGCTLDRTSSPLPQVQIVSPMARPLSLAPTLLTHSNVPSLLHLESKAPFGPPKQSSTEPTPSPSYGNTDKEGAHATIRPTVFEQAIKESPSAIMEPTPSPMRTDNCSETCIMYPKDTEPDECPIATIGTCGWGDRGDGICPFEGYCCSKWGWCGTTAEYCEDDSDFKVPSPSTLEGAPVCPTYSIDAGKCGNGKLGEGLCAEASDCCSAWGYCGSGENYCYTTMAAIAGNTHEAGTIGGCGGGGIGNGICSNGLCCSRFGFCGEGEEYCTGVNEMISTDVMPSDDLSLDVLSNKTQFDPDFAESIHNNLPNNLKAEVGYRCGLNEVDARSNCKLECTHHIQCADGEECWGIQLNYCNTFEDGTHPICTNLDMADNGNRCGYDETSARSHCGAKCQSDSDCGSGEFCFPTLLNLCECHEIEETEESRIVFDQAKALLTPYFVEQDSSGVTEGIPRSNSDGTATSSILVCALGLLNIMAICFL